MENTNKPWLTEPLKYLFESHGYVCLAMRPTELDTWCGYIHISTTHPLFGVHYDDVELTVHGGLTYSGIDDASWCFGFDCAHIHDYIPSREALYAEAGIKGAFPCDEEYRTLDYVINELDHLAKQLREKEQ